MSNLYFIWLLDCSGSMSGDRIQSLIQAIPITIPNIKEAAKRLNSKIFIEAVKFSNGAQWHMGNGTKANPIPIENFFQIDWKDFKADGDTDMGTAFSLVNKFFSGLDKYREGKDISPLLVLVTDGNYTDDFDKGLNELLSTEWGRHSIKIGIRIGEETHRQTLEKFIGNPDIPIITVQNSYEIAKYINYTTETFFRE